MTKKLILLAAFVCVAASAQTPTFGYCGSQPSGGYGCTLTVKQPSLLRKIFTFGITANVTSVKWEIEPAPIAGFTDTVTFGPSAKDTFSVSSSAPIKAALIGTTRYPAPGYVPLLTKEVTVGGHTFTVPANYKSIP